MRVVVDRPADYQVWGRAELIAGWIEGTSNAHGLGARCGDVELTVRTCLHPRGLDRPDLHGFWTELILQRHLDCVRDGTLVLEFYRDDAPVARVALRISAVATELARSYPLDIDEYPVPPATVGAVVRPPALVFPGLGGTGGSSLNAVMRTAMLRAGHELPVYDEANAPALWARIRARRPVPGFRWIDGHGCYSALDIAREPVARVTLLRDPIRRIVSVFNYGTLVHPELFNVASFEDWVGAGEARRHSQAAGLLRAAGRHDAAEQRGTALHRTARDEVLHAYALVGLAEQFEECIFLLCQLGSYDRIGMWRRVLAAPRAVDAEALPAVLRHRLAEELAPDLQLYEEARELLGHRLTSAALGPALGRYREAAARRPELPEAAKAVECLRWRQVLTDHHARPTLETTS